MPTKLGEKNSAEVHIHTYSKMKFVYWDKKILTNKVLIDAIKRYTDAIKEKEEYNLLVRNYYTDKGYILWDFSEKKTQDNRNINYIAKKDREIILMNCPNTPNDITLDDIKEFESQKDEFLVKNPVFEDYEIKLQYNLSSFALSESAFTYIKDHTEFISYQIIK